MTSLSRLRIASVVSILPFLAVLSAGCSGPSAAPVATGPNDADVRSVQVVSARRGPVGRRIVLPAEVRSWQEVTLHARVPGYVRTIAVDRGDHVKSGAVVAELEVPELAADVARARAEVALAATLSGRLGRARTKAPDLVVAQTMDEATAKLDVTRAWLARAETLLAFASIRAPFDGVVTERFVDVGAFVPAATGTATPRTAAVVTVADFGKVRIAVAVPESETSFVHNGTRGDVRIGEAGSTAYRSTASLVTRIAWTLERDTRTMMAELDLDNADHSLRPGMLVHVELEVETHEGAIVVPSRAFVVEKGGTFVFVFDGKDRVRKAAVRSGFHDGVHVEILDGVADGQQIVLLDKQVLRDGQAVQATEVP
ncbi:MAG: efflux RND transporter periplasmic adaptor subunit [Candidatus Binatia bacterium]